MVKKLVGDKGFTLVELLVVIAIIVVLAAVVLFNVTGFINKAKDAAVKQNLAVILTDGVSYYTTSGSYANFGTGVCSGDSTFVGPCTAITTAGYTLTFTCSGTSCTSNTTGWCAQVTLKSPTNTYCVDSSGKKLEKSSGGTCVAGVCN